MHTTHGVAGSTRSRVDNPRPNIRQIPARRESQIERSSGWQPDAPRPNESHILATALMIANPFQDLNQGRHGHRDAHNPPRPARTSCAEQHNRALRTPPRRSMPFGNGFGRFGVQLMQAARTTPEAPANARRIAGSKWGLTTLLPQAGKRCRQDDTARAMAA